MADVSLYWFRDDLRLTDLPGLSAAAQAGPVIPVFVRDPDLGDAWRMGSASQWWLHHSLLSLRTNLAEQGLELILRSGETVEALAALAADTGATSVYCSRHYQPWSAALETALRKRLSDTGVGLKRYPGTLLHEPEDVATGGGTPFKVFTPFWRACNRRPDPHQPVPVPEISAYNGKVESEELSDWQLLPTSPNWAFGWNDLWRPGEAGAQATLHQFLDHHVQDYGDGRDIPAVTVILHVVVQKLVQRCLRAGFARAPQIVPTKGPIGRRG